VALRVDLDEADVEPVGEPVERDRLDLDRAGARGRADYPVVGSVLLGARLEHQPAGFPPRGRLDHMDAACKSVTGDVRAQQLRDDGVRFDCDHTPAPADRARSKDGVVADMGTDVDHGHAPAEVSAKENRLIELPVSGHGDRGTHYLVFSRKEQRADVGRELNRILGACDHRAS
jgi:hypothetical protein